MFPSGRVGAALFALRSITAFVVVQTQFPSHEVSVGTSGAISIVTAGLLAVGFLTPCSFVICISASAWTVLVDQHRSVSVLIMPILMTLVGALLGPGAFSLDALIYGRRLISFGTTSKGYGTR